jgi:hypothetical protein
MVPLERTAGTPTDEVVAPSAVAAGDETRVFDFELTEADYQHFLLGLDPKSGKGKTWATILIAPLVTALLFPALASLSSFAGHAGPKTMDIRLVWLVSLFVFSVCAYSEHERLWSQPLKRARGRYGLIGHQKILITPEYLEMTLRDRVIRRAWAEFSHIKAENEFISIFIVNKVMALVPISALVRHEDSILFRSLLDGYRTAIIARNIEAGASNGAPIWPPKPLPNVHVLHAPPPEPALSAAVRLEYNITRECLHDIFVNTKIVPRWFVIFGILIATAFCVMSVHETIGGSYLQEFLVGVIGFAGALAYWSSADIALSVWQHTITHTTLTTDYETLQMVTPTVAFSYPVATLHSVKALARAVVIGVDPDYKLLVPNTAFASAEEARRFVERMKAGIAAGKAERGKS